MYKKKQGMKRCVLAVLLMGALALTGCRKHTEHLEPEERTALSERDSRKAVHVILETEETAEARKETESAETKAPLKLPEIVSTSSNASQVARAYALEPGSVVDEALIDEIGEDAFFVQMMIDDTIFSRMDGKSYKEGCQVPVTDLRYLRLLHYDLEGNIHVGELVLNKSVSDDVLDIFHKLYEARYPIEKVILPDEYEGADILLSSGDNNTAAFNDRNTVGKTSKSLHAQGIAIDINPLYNPYIMYQPDGSYEVAPANGSPYADRQKEFPYKIDKNDLCYKLFTEAGFTWGGIWNNPDYMHFFRK